MSLIFVTHLLPVLPTHDRALP